MKAPNVGDVLEIDGIEVRVVAINGDSVEVVPTDMEGFLRDHADLLDQTTMVEVEEPSAYDVGLPPLKLEFAIEDALYVLALLRAGKIEPLI